MDDDSASLGYAKPRHYADDYVMPTDDSLSQALRALRTAPPDEREAFWEAVRGSFSVTTPEQEAAGRARREAQRAAEDAKCLVYYVRFGDRVKIGTTANLKGRLHSLPHDEVLATEPGSYPIERARHAAFADLRVTGEWFRYEEPLVSHIAGLQ